MPNGSSQPLTSIFHDSRLAAALVELSYRQDLALRVGKCHEIENFWNPICGIAAGQSASSVTAGLGSYIRAGV